MQQVGAGAGQQVGAGQQALFAALRAARRASRPHFLAGGQQVGAGSQQVGAGAGQQVGAGAGSQQTGAGAGAGQQTGAGAGSQQVGAGSQQVGAGAQQSLFALRQPNKPASLVGAKMTLRRATSPNANTDRIVVSTKKVFR